MKGWPASMGSKLTDKTPVDADAPAVARLREAGAIVFAQSTSSEFGHKGVTDTPLNGVTRNPWNPERTPGGSSGGAGAAVAAGLAPLAIGTDGGGSVRIPSSFNGLVGLKATYGRVPNWPPTLNGDLSNTGPMCRTAHDCALMMNAIARPDPRDPTQLPEDHTDYVKALKHKHKKPRVAFLLRMSEHPLDIEVAALVTKAAKRVAKMGWEVEEITEPPFPHADAGRIFMTHWFSNLQRLLDIYPESRHVEFDPSLLAGSKGRSPLHHERRGDGLCRPARDVGRLEPVLREIRLPADADRRRAALRGVEECARRPGGQAELPVVALHRDLQPDAPSRGLGAVRVEQRRPAGRPADRVGPLQGCRGARCRGALHRGASVEISRVAGEGKNDRRPRDDAGAPAGQALQVAQSLAGRGNQGCARPRRSFQPPAQRLPASRSRRSAACRARLGEALEEGRQATLRSRRGADHDQGHGDDQGPAHADGQPRHRRRRSVDDRCAGGAAPARGGHGAARQDDLAGIWLEGRDRLRPVRRHAQSVEDRAHLGRLVGRRRGRRGGRHGQPGDRHRRRRLGAHPLLLLRPVRAEAHPGARAALPAIGDGHAVSYRTDDPHGARRRR